MIIIHINHDAFIYNMHSHAFQIILTTHLKQMEWILLAHFIDTQRVEAPFPRVLYWKEEPKSCTDISVRLSSKVIQSRTRSSKAILLGNVICGPTGSASPGNLSEMQNLSLRLIQWKKNLHFNQNPPGDLYSC